MNHGYSHLYLWIRDFFINVGGGTPYRRFSCYMNATKSYIDEMGLIIKFDNCCMDSQLLESKTTAILPISRCCWLL